jgi:hypothetical protein
MLTASHPTGAILQTFQTAMAWNIPPLPCIFPELHELYEASRGNRLRRRQIP